MPVIINELDVIAPPPPREESQAQDGSAAQSAGLSTHDVRAAVVHILERRLRLQAK